MRQWIFSPVNTLVLGLRQLLLVVLSYTYPAIFADLSCSQLLSVYLIRVQLYRPFIDRRKTPAGNRKGVNIPLRWG